MLLVIPAIEIEGCRCCRTISESSGVGADESYSVDPKRMAMLWRRENAKVLHVTDFDGLYSNIDCNRQAIVDMAAAIEIPVELLARFATIDDCRRWLDAGIYRLIVHDLILRDPEGVRTLVTSYGGSRIVAGAITRDGVLCTTCDAVPPIDAVEFARRAADLGVRRLFFTDREYEGGLRGPNLEQIERIARSTSMPVTAAGGVASVEDLWALQALEPIGVDSVVIGRAFYENRFVCQQLWRDVEAMRADARDGAVSTSELRASGDRTRRPRDPGEKA